MKLAKKAFTLFKDASPSKNIKQHLELLIWKKRFAFTTGNKKLFNVTNLVILLCTLIRSSACLRSRVVRIQTQIIKEQTPQMKGKEIFLEKALLRNIKGTDCFSGHANTKEILRKNSLKQTLRQEFFRAE